MPANSGGGEARSRSRTALALAVAFALVVALEATLFGVYVPGNAGHEGGSSREVGALLVTIAALFISLAGIAFPFFLQTRNPDRLGAGSGPEATRLAETHPLPWLALAAFSTSAALVHFAVLWEHFNEFWLFGAFFAVAASLQLTCAALLIRCPSRALLRGGAVGNLSVVAVWVLSRTAGLPLDPDPWRAESVGVADSLATAFEVTIVFGAIVLLRSRAARFAVPPRIGTLATWTLALSLVALTTIALMSAVGGGP